jgi:glucose/arabinose dehydrogenase
MRGRLNEGGTALENVQVIFRQEPAHTGNNHFGSRLVFDRGGNLFVALGDRFDLREQAQNPSNHIGKVVHITPEGRPAPNNPFLNREGARPETWSLGHRNIQAAALHRARRPRGGRGERPAERQELRLAGHHLRGRLFGGQDR